MEIPTWNSMLVYTAVMLNQTFEAEALSIIFFGSNIPVKSKSNLICVSPIKTKKVPIRDIDNFVTKARICSNEIWRRKKSAYSLEELMLQ